MNFLTTDIEKNFLYLYKIFYYDIYLSCLFLIIINYILNTNISILLLNIITILTFNMGIPYVLGFNIKHFEKIIKNYINTTKIIKEQIEIIDGDIKKITSKNDYISELIDST
jgi:hypothetical protein